MDKASKAVITLKNPNECSISGGLDFDNIMDLFKQACDIIDTCPDNKITFNFSGVSQSNSGGLALLMGLLRHAADKEKCIQFLHLPAKLIATAKISDMDILLHESE